MNLFITSLLDHLKPSNQYAKLFAEEEIHLYLIHVCATESGQKLDALLNSYTQIDKNDFKHVQQAIDKRCQVSHPIAA